MNVAISIAHVILKICCCDSVMFPHGIKKNGSDHTAYNRSRKYYTVHPLFPDRILFNYPTGCVSHLCGWHVTNLNILPNAPVEYEVTLPYLESTFRI